MKNKYYKVVAERAHLGRGNTNYHDGELCEWVTEHNGVDYYTELKNWDEEVAKWQSRSE